MASCSSLAEGHAWRPPAEPLSARRGRGHGPPRLLLTPRSQRRTLPRLGPKGACSGLGVYVAPSLPPVGRPGSGAHPNSCSQAEAELEARRCLARQSMSWADRCVCVVGGGTWTCPTRPAWSPRPHTCAHTLTATGETGRGGLHAGLGTRFRNQLSPTRSFKQKPGTHSPGELNKAGNSLASFLSLAPRANQGTRTVSTWNWNQTLHLSQIPKALNSMWVSDSGSERRKRLGCLWGPSLATSPTLSSHPKWMSRPALPGALLAPARPMQPPPEPPISLQALTHRSSYLSASCLEPTQ